MVWNQSTNSQIQDVCSKMTWEFITSKNLPINVTDVISFWLGQNAECE